MDDRRKASVRRAKTGDATGDSAPSLPAELVSFRPDAEEGRREAALQLGRLRVPRNTQPSTIRDARKYGKAISLKNTPALPSSPPPPPQSPLTQLIDKISKHVSHCIINSHNTSTNKHKVRPNPPRHTHSLVSHLRLTFRGGRVTGCEWKKRPLQNVGG
jgi:hypothetical protein